MNSKILALAISTALASSIIVTNVQAEKTSYDTNTGTLTIPEIQVLDDEVVSYRATMSLTSTQNVFLVVETEEIETTNSEEVATFSLDKSELYVPIVEVEFFGFIPSVEATFHLESLFPLTFKLTSYSFLEKDSENNNFDDDSGSDDDSKSGKKRDDDDDSKSGKKRDDDDDSKSGKKRDDDDDSKSGKKRDDDDDSKSGKNRDDDDDSKSSKKDDDKVTICHKDKTMVVSESALDGHLGHGDTLNACDDDSSDDDSSSNDDDSEDDNSDSKVDVCHEGAVVKTVELPEINIPESITKYVESPGDGVLDSTADYVLEGNLRDVDTCSKGKSKGNGSSTDDYDVHVTPARDAVDAKDAVDAENAIGAEDAQGVNIIPSEDDDSISEDDSSSDDKITICHKGRTMKFSESALPAHLRHGDTVGVCDDDSKSGKKDDDDDSKSGKKDDDDDSKSGKKDDDDDSKSGKKGKS